MDVEGLAARYRTTILAWDALQAEPKKANRVFRDLHGIYKALRDSDAGRRSIAALMDDPAIAVRLTAAAHSLFSVPEKAEVVLRAIEHDPKAGIYSVDASYTLREFHEGRLSDDW